MKIAYKHLINNIENKPSIEDVSDKLFQLGHEHETEDDIFDIEFTPNRGDCLSVHGLLRDLNVFYDINLNQKKYEEEIKDLEINFTNNAIESCEKISFLKIEIDGEIKDYKGELKEYFKLLDTNKKNFFTDISNYISYETGQPTHCYDSEKVSNTISLEVTDLQCNFETLLDKTIKLSGKNLVFYNKNKIINLAGIVGSKETSCSKNTNSVIVECASFNPEAIIGQSIKYGIQSDAAYKFERGVDPCCHDIVLRRFIYMVSQYANITSLELFSKPFIDKHRKVMKYDLKTINEIIGIDIKQNQFESYLNSLKFKILKDKIEIPSFRTDISSQNDLAEEIARCIGYNNISSRPLKLSNSNSEKPAELIKEKIVKSLLIDNGFFEVINFPFSKTSNYSIKIDNPIDSNKPYLRENLTESLIENLLFNERRQQDSIKLFEISDIYNIDKDGSHRKEKKLAIIGSGRLGKDYINFSKKIDAKYICSILEEYIPNIDKAIEEIPRDTLISKIKSKIFNLEINLSEINDNILTYKPVSSPPKTFNQYTKISEFPKIYRDLSFSLSEYNSIDNLITEVSKFENQYLKEVFIFDFFENSKINILKVGYRFIFQSNEKTLTDNDVNIIIKSLIDKTLKIPGIKILGLD